MVQDPSANLCQSVFEFGRGVLRSKTPHRWTKPFHLKNLEGRISLSGLCFLLTCSAKPASETRSPTGLKGSYRNLHLSQPMSQVAVMIISYPVYHLAYHLRFHFCITG